MSAKTQVYTMDELGEVSKISDNGRYAAITDIEDNMAYLWVAETGRFIDICAPLGDPDSEPSSQCITGTTALDVTDDGMVVGSVIYRDGHQVPSYYIDGEWYPLELHPAARNTNEAIAVTPDGRTIAGYQFINDPTSAIGGRYYPVQWKRNDSGEYELTAYTDIELPEHQGFYPLAQSSDGRVICGQVYAGVGSMLPVLLIDGKMKMFDEVETKSEPFEFKGKWYCGVDDNGKQIWTDDPEDPRIVLFPSYYINGYKDSADNSFEGSLLSCDAQGNFYGMRTRAENVDEEGNGTLVKGAAIYNIHTGEWTYDTNCLGYTAGLNGNYILTSTPAVIVDGNKVSVSENFDFDTERPLEYLCCYSSDGKVVGGMTYVVNPANGEKQYFPIILVLDEPILSGIQAIYGGVNETPCIIVSNGRIDIANARDMAVYDLDGHLIGSTASTSVAPGIYVVKADRISKKVLVK